MKIPRDSFRGTAALALALLTVSLAAGVGSAAAKGLAAKDPARQITDQIICPCSCGEILTGCTCDTGKAMRGYVDSELKAGKNKDQITAALVGKYGEVILGAPKAKGFNLVVWVAPFVATLVGFAIAALVLKRWVGRRAAPAAAGAAGSSGLGPNVSAEESLAALRARAETELERLRE